MTMMTCPCYLYIASFIGKKGGVPIQLMRENNMAMSVQYTLIPETTDAVQLMESKGSHLTRFSSFGSDPLANRVDLVQQRQDVFFRRYPDFSTFFHTVVNSDYGLFRDGLLYFIQTSMDLVSSL